MNSREKYHFDQFTLRKYEELIITAKLNYDFIFYRELSTNSKKSIILRHDFEFSPPLALKMAEIESKYEIKSTTFVNIHSEYYNVFEISTFEIIQNIIGMGHQIGVHFDAHFYKVENEHQLETLLLREKELLEHFFNINIDSFSFHNTNEFVLGFKNDYYAGLINTYSRKYFDNIGYCADSTGYWRYENLFERIKEAKDKTIQILIHDGMWQDEVLPPRRRIFKVIDERAQYLKDLYDSTLIKFGAKNIDYDGEC